MDSEENPHAGAGGAGSDNRQQKYNPSIHPEQLCATALRYAIHGWPVFPVHGIIDGKCTCKNMIPRCSPGKHPLTPNGFKNATTDRNTIRNWWGKWSHANIGIRTGAESGFWVLDVDQQHGGLHTLQALLVKYGKLPKTLIVKTGGGGMHIYFLHPGFRINCRQAIVPGLDVRGDDGYVIGPPSWHESGDKYAWKNDADIAEAPAWLLEIITQRIQRKQRSTEDMEERKESKVMRDDDDSYLLHSSNKIDEIIEAVIKDSQSLEEGKQKDLVFLFARHLKAIPALSDAAACELKLFVRRLHDKSIPYIGTKSFTATWSCFMRVWKSIRFFFGEDPILNAMERAKKAPLPVELIKMEIDCPKAQLLAAICRELQRAWRDLPFFLSCRKAGELIGVTHKMASNYLNMFVEEKLLELIEKGGEHGAIRRASRYRYLGALDY